MTLAYDPEAERIVLGSCMMSGGNTVGECAKILDDTDFVEPGHADVFGAIVELFLEGSPTEPTFVADRLTRHGHLARVGGKPYLADLIHDAGAATFGRGAAVIVKQRAYARSLATAIDVDAGNLSDDDLRGCATQVQTLLAKLERDEVEDEPDLIGSDVGAHLKLIESRQTGRLPGLTSGLPALDGYTSGFAPGQLIIVGARPSHGKTAIMLQASIAAAIEKKRVAFFTLEMTPEEIRDRAFSQVSQADLWKIRGGKLEDDEWQRVVNAAAQIQDLLITVDGRGGVSMVEVMVEARKLKATGGLDLVVLDYLQLLKPVGTPENRTNAVSEMSRSLKLLARDLQVPVIVGSQLNRNVESRQDKRPTLADLRESGALEQDSDVVILLYREDLYDDDAAKEGKAELIIAKQRNGPTGNVPTLFHRKTAMFDDRGR